MANDELIRLLKSLQGSGPGASSGLGLAGDLPALIAAATGSKPAGQESLGSTIASATLRGVGGGLTLLPVVTGLLRLFGVGKQKAATPEPERFTLPAPIRTEAGLSKTGATFLIDRGASDNIRPLTATGGSKSQIDSPMLLNQERDSGQPTSTAITVNVQAMDSQSFLDRREDIARAVREAMLQSHSLNDVVSEL